MYKTRSIFVKKSTNRIVENKNKIRAKTIIDECNVGLFEQILNTVEGTVLINSRLVELKKYVSQKNFLLCDFHVFLCEKL